MPAPTIRPHRSWATLALVTTLALSQSGCLLRGLFGGVFTDDVSTFIDLVFDEVSVALCFSNTDEDGIETVTCQYRIFTEDGGSTSASTVRLLGEFGVFGVVVDPVIVQVPLGSTVETATVDDGSGPQDLLVTVTPSFEAQPGVVVDAEPGHTFFIVDLPPTIEALLPEVEPELGPTFDFAFGFRIPGPPSGAFVPVKAMYTGRVESAGATYYPPMYPCTTDFSQVPVIDIPRSPNLSGFIFDLLFLYMDNDSGCDGEVYDFTPIDPQPLTCDLDGDSDVDRLDIAEIAASRNQPASGPDDPRDADGDGTITALDGRKCVLSCTRPRCATE